MYQSRDSGSGYCRYLVDRSYSNSLRRVRPITLGRQYLKHTDYEPDTDGCKLVADGGVAPGPFVRASEIYDAETGESLDFDWERLQPLDESQVETEQPVPTFEEGM